MGRVFLTKQEALSFQLCSDLVLYLSANNSRCQHGLFCLTMTIGPNAEGEVAKTVPLTPVLIQAEEVAVLTIRSVWKESDELIVYFERE